MVYQKQNFVPKQILKADDMNRVEEALCQFSNPNLLINGDFRVNQRGLTEYAPSGNVAYYTVDRWFIFPSINNGEGHKVTVNSGYITFANTTENMSAFMCQRFETALKGTYTLTVKVKALSKAMAMSYRDNGTIYKAMDLKEGINEATLEVASLDMIRFNIEGVASIDIEYVKLEYGSLATPFVPRLYGEELALCQRYFMPLPYNQPCYTSGSGILYMCLDSRTLNMRAKPTFSGATEITMVFDGHSYSYPITTVNTDNVVSKGYITVDYTYSNKTSYAHKTMVAYFNKQSYLDSEIK